ncbi:hypothetical protein BGZ82_000818 [Podila clonocystis]|nr:hypothetical protein BGZ82_000818 [Podila clonocystis]
MRKYADTHVEINTKAFGTGFLSHTQEVSCTTIDTDLPEYYVTGKKGTKGGKINYGEFVTQEDEYDYEDSLNMRKGIEVKRGDSRLKKSVKFNLIDTPGLNSTAGDDVARIQKIFGGLNKAKTIHLLLITISLGPFTQGLKDAIKAYVDMFPGFNGIIAFVHTHFDYKNFHSARIQVSNAIDLRMQSLYGIMGRKTFPHFKIDCDVYNKKPIRDCITQNTIQKILELATFNHAVDMLQTVINKTRKMRDIDNILRDKFEATSATIEKTLRFKDQEEGELLAQIFRNETEVHKLEARIKVLDEFFVRHDVPLLEILHEDRRDMADGQGKNITIRYPEEGERDKFTIKKRELLCHSIRVIEEIPTDEKQKRWAKEGQSTWKTWQGLFERTSPQHSVLHIKIYSTKSDMHQEEITKRRKEHKKLKEELEVAKTFRDTHALQNESKKQQITEIVDNHSEGIQILGYVSNEVLAPDVFNALMEAQAYLGDTALCAKKVQAVYMSLMGVKPAKRDLKATEKQKATNFLPASSPVDPKVSLSLSVKQTNLSLLSQLDDDPKPSISRPTTLPRAHPESYPHSDYMKPSVMTEESFPSGSLLSESISSYHVIKPRYPAAIKLPSEGSIPGHLIRDQLKSPLVEPSELSTSTSDLSDRSPSLPISTYPAPQKHSIFILGKSQVGKTALIEYIKNYCSPNYAIDQTRIGDGTFSKTEEVSSFLTKSSLPLYEVYNKSSGATIDLDGKRKGADAEDFQDLLLSCEDEVGLRLLPEDPIGSTPDHQSGSSLDIMEFEIIDTPGFCNHKGQDRELSLGMIDAILIGQSFDLVLIVINIHDALSAEELLSFQYFSEVLGPLNANIAFLYTHTKYSDYHLANPSQYMALANKTLFLSSIFRQPEGDASIQRIKNIIHPSDFDDMQRKLALVRIYGESRIQSKPLGQPSSQSEVYLQTINILIIGDAQSGKSYLIESMKLYVDPWSISSVELIAKGENGVVDEIISGTSFVADMHTIDILKAEKARDHRVINIKQEAESLSVQEFAELLAMGHGPILTRTNRSSMSRKYKFSIFEVPSWQEDVDSLSNKAAMIRRAVSESDKEINQVLVTLGPEAITNSTRMVISTLVNMFPAITPLLSFVHTKVYYPNLHTSNTYFHDSVNAKKVELQGLIKSDPPIFKIDNNLYMNRPVQRVITLNTIHDILLAAIKTKPKYSVLVLGKTQSGKSSFIQHIKKYTDPAYTINQSLLGMGNTSCTDSVQQIFVHSDVPAYEVLDIAKGSTFNPQRLNSIIQSQDRYIDLIHGRESKYELRMVPQNPARLPSELVEFRFLDTPGINDTQHRDDVFARNIIEEVIATRSFNLILITVSTMSAISMEYGFALEYYAKVLQGLRSNIAFLYTHVDYADCHHTNTHHHLSMVTRHNAFSSIFKDLRYLPKEKSVDGTDTEDLRHYRRFMIDFNMKRRPVIQCLIRNTLRDILQLAVTSPPVELDTSSSNIERIRAIVHPDKGNREYRDRFRTDMEALTTELTDIGASNQLLYDSDTEKEEKVLGYSINPLPKKQVAGEVAFDPSMTEGFAGFDHEDYTDDDGDDDDDNP